MPPHSQPSLKAPHIRMLLPVGQISGTLVQSVLPGAAFGHVSSDWHYLNRLFLALVAVGFVPALRLANVMPHCYGLPLFCLCVGVSIIINTIMTMARRPYPNHRKERCASAGLNARAAQPGRRYVDSWH